MKFLANSVLPFWGFAIWKNYRLIIFVLDVNISLLKVELVKLHLELLRNRNTTFLQNFFKGRMSTETK